MTGTCLKSHLFPHLAAVLSAIRRCILPLELMPSTVALNGGFPLNTANGDDSTSAVLNVRSTSLSVWDLVPFSTLRD